MALDANSWEDFLASLSPKDNSVRARRVQMKQNNTNSDNYSNDVSSMSSSRPSSASKNPQQIPPMAKQPSKVSNFRTAAIKKRMRLSKTKPSPQDQNPQQEEE